jgi:iron uptake system component EfeO
MEKTMHRPIALTLAVLAAACGPRALTPEEQQKKAVEGMHASILSDIHTLKAAAQDLKTAAPVNAGRGWDATQDAAAVASMKAAWGRARTAYEHIEGAIAPLFPNIDAAVDERYDGFLEGLQPTGDQNLFDGTGVTGMHAVERILWADTIPAGVKTMEMSLPGYKAAAFPASEAEARAFKEQLVAQLITDVETLETQWTPARIDLAGAWQGLMDLMAEQREKVNNAANNLEESRYSQRTMRDLRDNLDGTLAIYAIFQPWVVATRHPTDPTHDGEQIDAKVQAGFTALKAAYDAVVGDAIPTPPATWSAESPSAADLQTPFGRLYTQVRAATDPSAEASIVDEMEDAGELLGFPGGE